MEELQIKLIIYMNPGKVTFPNSIHLNSVMVFTGNFNGTALISMCPLTRIANLIHPFILPAFFSL